MYKFLERNDDDGLVYIDDAGKVVAAITMCTPEFQAMVDAAPDMLKALLEVKQYAMYSGNLVLIVNDAIAKAGAAS